MQSSDARRVALEADGWVVTSRSWAAQLTASNANVEALRVLVERGRHHGDVREITNADRDSVLALDRATRADYPGGIATQHEPLTASSARVTATRRGFGVFAVDGRALAITYVDIDQQRAETDFTVVTAGFRGLGLATAVKAASVLALLREGVEAFRTGGAAENSAILGSNLRMGYVVDQEWLTLSPTR